MVNLFQLPNPVRGNKPPGTVKHHFLWLSAAASWKTPIFSFSVAAIPMLRILKAILLFSQVNAHIVFDEVLVPSMPTFFVMTLTVWPPLIRHRNLLSSVYIA